MLCSRSVLSRSEGRPLESCGALSAAALEIKKNPRKKHAGTRSRRCVVKVAQGTPSTDNDKACEALKRSERSPEGARDTHISLAFRSSPAGLALVLRLWCEGL